MKILTVVEKHPATTATTLTTIRYNKQDVPSNDISLYHLIEKYDSFLLHFHPKWKPFWQIPPLPEYV